MCRLKSDRLTVKTANENTFYKVQDAYLYSLTHTHIIVRTCLHALRCSTVPMSAVVNLFMESGSR